MSKFTGLHLWTVNLHRTAVDLLILTNNDDLLKATEKAQKTLAVLKRQDPDTYRRATVRGISLQGTIDA